MNPKTAHLRKMAIALDSSFVLPMGWRIGWDGILGFIPGIGDLITDGFSFYIVYQSALLGASPSVLLRMGLNILIDNLIDLIPLLGNFLDFIWKSNLKNVDLLDAYLENPRNTIVHSRLVVAMAILMGLTIISVSIYATFLVLSWIFSYFQTQNTQWV